MKKIIMSIGIIMGISILITTTACQSEKRGVYYCDAVGHYVYFEDVEPVIYLDLDGECEATALPNVDDMTGRAMTEEELVRLKELFAEQSMCDYYYCGYLNDERDHTKYSYNAIIQLREGGFYMFNLLDKMVYYCKAEENKVSKLWKLEMSDEQVEFIAELIGVCNK